MLTAPSVIRRLLLAAALLAPISAHAQMAVIAPRAPNGDNSDKIANTAWVTTAIAGSSLALANGEIFVGNASNLAAPVTPSGDLTISNLGVFTLATVNSNVGSFGSATQCVAFTTNGKGLITAASATTCMPGIASVTGLGTGGATALGVNVGTAGAFVVNGGVLGTPSSGTATNLTGLPISTGLTGAGTGVLTALGVNVGSAGAFVTFNGALGTPSSGALTNATGLPISTGVSGLGTNVATALGNTLNAANGLVGFSGALGTPTSATLTNATGLPISTGVSGLGTGVATAAALAVNTSGGFPTDGAWSSVTVTPTCGSATITTNSARDRLYAKTMHLEIDFTITAIGSCSSALTFTLPAVTANSGGGLVGREFGVSGKGLTCDVRSGSTTATCGLADFSALQVNAHLVASGVFEIQ